MGLLEHFLVHASGAIAVVGLQGVGKVLHPAGLSQRLGRIRLPNPALVDALLNLFGKRGQRLAHEAHLNARRHVAESVLGNEVHNRRGGQLVDEPVVDHHVVYALAQKRLAAVHGVLGHGALVHEARPVLIHHEAAEQRQAEHRRVVAIRQAHEAVGGLHVAGAGLIDGGAEVLAHLGTGRLGQPDARAVVVLVARAVHDRAGVVVAQHVLVLNKAAGCDDDVVRAHVGHDRSAFIAYAHHSAVLDEQVGDLGIPTGIDAELVEHALQRLGALRPTGGINVTAAVQHKRVLVSALESEHEGHAALDHKIDALA